MLENITDQAHQAVQCERPGYMRESRLLEKPWSAVVRFSHRLDAVQRVVLDVSYFGIRLPSGHLFGRERPHEIDRRTLRVSWSQPSVIVLRLDDHRHPVVQRLEELVRSVVITVSVSSGSFVEGSRQRSQRPANAYGEPSFMPIANGCFVLASIFCHS